MTTPLPVFRFTRAVQQGITERLNKLGRQAGLRPLEWSIRMDGTRWRFCGYASMNYTDNEISAVLGAWAAFLGLDRSADPTSGSTEYAGQVDGWDVEVWGVNDPDTFEQPTQ